MQPPPPPSLCAAFTAPYSPPLPRRRGGRGQYYTDPEDGLPRVNALSAESPYTRWVVANHVGHHVVRGAGNFNIVFPGPDHLFGTAFVARRGE